MSLRPKKKRKSQTKKIIREGQFATLKSIQKSYRSRGHRESPLLENKDEKAATSFVKPLPDGRRKHIRIYKGRKYYTIDEHIDRYDPGKKPISHLVDAVNPPKHKKKRLRRGD